jgi:hypothetical protein
MGRCAEARIGGYVILKAKDKFIAWLYTEGRGLGAIGVNVAITRMASRVAVGEKSKVNL